MNSISLPLPPLPTTTFCNDTIFTYAIHHKIINIWHESTSRQHFWTSFYSIPIPPINELSPSLLRLKSLGSNSDGVLSPTTIGVNDLLNPSRSNGGYNQLDNAIPPPTQENSNPTAQSVLSDQTAPSSKSISSPQESESFSSNSLVSIPLVPILLYKLMHWILWMFSLMRYFLYIQRVMNGNNWYTFLSWANKE